jgi:uncharacterized protein (TIGR02186 family)
LLQWLPAAHAQELVADLSEHEIRISAGFSGTELLLFGVSDGPGDIVVIVSGPDTESIVRKKDRVSGIWINTQSVHFKNVPSFYHVGVSEGLASTDLGALLRENGVGFRYQSLKPEGDISLDEAKEFGNALVRRKQISRLYTPVAEGVKFVGGNLFRTTVNFPATVPTGEYRVEVYRVSEGWVKSVSVIPLHVAKAGLESMVYRFANDQPALYGLFAIAVAALAGYGAGMMFGRR